MVSSQKVPGWALLVPLPDEGQHVKGRCQATLRGTCPTQLLKKPLPALWFPTGEHFVPAVTNKPCNGCSINHGYTTPSHPSLPAASCSQLSWGNLKCMQLPVGRMPILGSHNHAYLSVEKKHPKTSRATQRQKSEDEKERGMRSVVLLIWLVGNKKKVTDWKQVLPSVQLRPCSSYLSSLSSFPFLKDWPASYIPSNWN